MGRGCASWIWRSGTAPGIATDSNRDPKKTMWSKYKYKIPRFWRLTLDPGKVLKTPIFGTCNSADFGLALINLFFWGWFCIAHTDNRTNLSIKIIGSQMSLGIRPYSTMPKASADCSDPARYSIPRYPMHESLRVASFWATGMLQLPTCWGLCSHFAWSR